MRSLHEFVVRALGIPTAVTSAETDSANCESDGPATSRLCAQTDRLCHARSPVLARLLESAPALRQRPSSQPLMCPSTQVHWPDALSRVPYQEQVGTPDKGAHHGLAEASVLPDQVVTA